MSIDAILANADEESGWHEIGEENAHDHRRDLSQRRGVLREARLHLPRAWLFGRNATAPAESTDDLPCQEGQPGFWKHAPTGEILSKVFLLLTLMGLLSHAPALGKG